MSDNIRIKTTPGGEDKIISVDINQKFDFIEILSLKISQEEVYKRFCSDYGVVVGRVIVNNGVGVPNAKVSIFIPIDETDLEDPEISGLYPFETITDKDSDGIEYNLLPRNARGKNECFTPIGTFPSKREIQDNPLLGEMYCKYYKFTATTNESGDFMFFGVPVGTHFMHVNADISDIGILSQRPYDIIRDGANEKQFISTTKFKSRKESSNLTQLKTFSPISVTVPPFWGDTEQCNIGIARADVDLATYITPTAIFMGSLVSDNDKHALSRTCRPRKKLGKMDELVTGEGRIEMIRKTHDGGVERYDVEGGQVIDGDGVWAYQIPMNMNYMITAEDGTFVPSGDPTRGIPTTARVRFRIGMNTQGDEGAFRTRAKYLVPHNPKTWSETDFSFDTSTNDKHFTDLSWNKIYTVKNHITRVQPNRNSENRNFIGFKNVDDSKDKNPIPFNKLDNDINPLYTYLCSILFFIQTLVGYFNIVTIPILNLVLIAINGVLFGICSALKIIASAVCFGNETCKKTLCIGKYIENDEKCNCGNIVSYIPYILLECNTENGTSYYAHGGIKGNAPSNPNALITNPFYAAYQATTKKQPAFFYANDGKDESWLKCQSLALADALDVFKFDFYNDWINGTLYSFLLKYKVKKRGTGRERFCEVDCGDFGGGVDNDKKNGADNPCKTNYILDICTKSTPKGEGGGINNDETNRIKSGYIKKYDGELYYTPISRDSDYKLFATDIVNLGSILDYDWEGKVKFYQFLSDTTFNIPPLNGDYEIQPNGQFSKKVEVSGFDSGENPGLIGNISCLGLNTNDNTCNNLKRLCELGVGLDQLREEVDNNGNLIAIVADNIINNQDVEAPIVRGIFTSLNTPNSNTINEVFIDKDITKYDYLDETYTQFRVNGGIKPSNANFWNKKIWVYDNSYYFYFGLNKGKTALSKMKLKYFVECTPEVDLDFYVIATNITSDSEASTPDGAISIEVIGGSGPYTFIWSGPTVNGIDYPITNTTQNISELYTGTYNVKVVDGVGNVTNATFFVPGPPAVSCEVNVIDVSTNGGSDGEIIVDINSGISPYTVTFTGDDIINPIVIDGLTNGTTFSNLKAGNYNVRVTDSGVPETFCEREILITEPTAISVELIANNISCNGANDGNITVIVSGGTGPYKYSWNNNKTTFFIDDLSQGTYELTVTDKDGNGQTVGPFSKTIYEPIAISYDNIIVTNGLCKIPSVTINNISGGLAPYTVTLEGGDNNDKHEVTVLYGGDALFNNLANGNNNNNSAYLLTIEDKNGCTIEEEIEVFKPSKPLTTRLTLDTITNPINPTIYLVISDGIFNSDIQKNKLYSYWVQPQIDTGNGWVDNGLAIDLGVSTIYQQQVTPTTPATKYRYIVYDKNKDVDGCNITTEEISI